MVAFSLLYFFPGHTKGLCAWTIKPTMTPMVLTSAYLGSAYFFIRVLSEPRWSAVKSGYPPVTLFASLLGVPTVVHRDKFNHGHVTFWLWASLYFTAPILVFAAWLANRRFAAQVRSGLRRHRRADRSTMDDGQADVPGPRADGRHDADRRGARTCRSTQAGP